MAETTERESREMAEDNLGETGCWLYRCAHAEVRTRRRTEKEANACVF